MYYDLAITQFKKTLMNLSRILDKGAQYAESKKVDFNTVFLQTRLAPDQFPLVRQIQIACDTAKLGVARLTGKDAPVHQDTETTLPELKTRIDQVVAFLNTFSEKDFDTAAERKISQPRWEGKYLTGEEYLIQHMLPNIYFHVTTAYAILRNNGVDIGKKDYLGEMPYKN